jgi:penicillin amidase
MNIYHALRLPALSALRIPHAGGPGTLNPLYGARGMEGASWRMVVELGTEVAAHGIYPGGQSGNPVSPRYDDRLTGWKNGELDELRFPQQAADLPADRVSAVLVLRPEQW